jgi:hypothetical protein
VLELAVSFTNYLSANCAAKMLGQNHFAEPNQYNLMFLRPILICRVDSRVDLGSSFGIIALFFFACTAEICGRSDGTGGAGTVAKCASGIAWSEWDLHG